MRVQLYFAAATVLLIGCASSRASDAPKQFWMRTDGQRITGNAKLEQQDRDDRTECFAIAQHGISADMFKGCMGAKGYTIVPAEEAEERLAAAAKARAANQKRAKPQQQTKSSGDGQKPVTASSAAGTQTEADKAALVKVMKDAVAARHGGVLPETMSEEDGNIAANAAIKWKAEQTAERTKRELEGMKVKPAHSDGYAAIYIAKEAIKSALRDPSSAVFGNNIFYANDRKVKGYYVPVVCGSVNSKNGFGGMSGQKKFVFFPTLDGRLALEGSVPDAIFVGHWNKMCAGKHD